MESLRKTATACIAASLVLLSAAASEAQVRPAAQRQLSRGQVAPPVRQLATARAQHNIFGTMGQIGPRHFLLKTRTGRIMMVDDTAAIARGSVSTPFFPGKVVMVSGSFDRTRLFHAVSVTRFTFLDNSTPRDN